MNLHSYESLRTPLPRVHGETWKFITHPNTLRYISSEITKRLTGTMIGKNIIVPDHQIISVLDSFYTNQPADAELLVMTTISFIVEHICTEMAQETQNNELNIWVQSQPQTWGLQYHDVPKMSQRRPTGFQISMRY